MDVHDLAASWKERTRFEFETRDVDATTATMTERPYVNRVPKTASGRDELKRSCHYRFICNSLPDMALRPISCTAGDDQAADVMIVSFTRATEIDWMLPGARARAHLRGSALAQVGLPVPGGLLI